MSASTITKYSRDGWYSLYLSGSSFEYNPYLFDETQAYERLNSVRNPLIKVYLSFFGSWVVSYSSICGVEGKVVNTFMFLEDAFEFAEDFVLLESQSRLLQFSEFVP